MREYHLSKRVMRTESPIMQVMKELNRTEDTVDLSQGIPFFGPPEEALENALRSSVDMNRYGPDAGDIDLKEAIIDKVSRKNGMRDTTITNVMVTAGANIAFLNAIAAICDPGDEVILLDPYYFNHGMTLDVLGVLHRHIAFDDPKIDPSEKLSEIICRRTRAVVIVSPNNPTGSVMTRSNVKKIADICNENGLWLISDETYEDFHYEDEHFSPGSISHELPVISLFSLSKSYGISGWRQGYMVFPETLHEGLLKVQDTTVICPSRIGQRLAYHCIKGHPDHTRNYIGELDSIRRELISWQEKNSDMITFSRPTGAFYTFLDIHRFHGMTSMELAEKVLSEADVLLVPGRPFGRDEPPHLRISYGNVEIDRVRVALERLQTFMEDY